MDQNDTEASRDEAALDGSPEIASRSGKTEDA
jgi:hypothetical protein